MDLSEIPHEEWDDSLWQLALLDSSEEEDRDRNLIFEHENLDVVPLLSQPPYPDKEDAIDEYNNMDAVSERSVPTCFEDDACQLEQELESIMQLTLEYSTEFSDSTALQEYGIPAGTYLNCDLETTPSDILQMEGIHEADIFGTTTFPSENDTMGISEFMDSLPVVTSDLYQVSLNEYLMYSTNAIVGMSEIQQGSLSYQNDASLWITPSQEYTGYPHVAVMNGGYENEMEQEVSCTKEEGNVHGIKKNNKKRKRQSGYGEERDCVQRRVKRGSRFMQRGRKKSSSHTHIENDDEDWKIEHRGRIKPSHVENDDEDWRIEKRGRERESQSSGERGRRKKRGSQIGQRGRRKRESQFVQMMGGERLSRFENDEDWKVVQWGGRKRESQFIVTREDDKQSVRRSERVCRAPPRYIDEWCKPKTRGSVKARKAAMTASGGLGLVASRSPPGSSMVHKLEDADKTGFMGIISSEGNLPPAGIQETK